MKTTLILILLSFSTYSLAQDGTDDEGNSVGIGSRNLVRAGNDIEVEVGEEGTIIGVDMSKPYPYSVEVAGKPVELWDDAAWHMMASELEPVA